MYRVKVLIQLIIELSEWLILLKILVNFNIYQKLNNLSRWSSFVERN